MNQILLYDEGAQGGSQLGGGQLSRLSLMERLSSEFEPVLLTSRDGKLADRARDLGLRIEVRNICGDLKRYTRSELQSRPWRCMRLALNVAIAAKRYCRVVADIEPDVIHANENFSRTVAAVASPATDIPLIAMIDGEWRNGLVNQAMRAIYQRSFNKLLAVSDSVAEPFLNDGCPTNKIQTVYPGIELERFKNLSGVNDIGGPQELAIVVVGSLVPVKGHDTLLSALSQVENDRIQCHVVGTGPLEDELHRMVARLDIENRVTFHGFRNDIPDVMYSADISAVPSYSEAFPSVLLEAMASGTPVVASDVGGIPEAVVDGETGILVPPGDANHLSNALTELANDPKQREAMGKLGQHRVAENFSFESGVRTIQDIYRSLARD